MIVPSRGVLFFHAQLKFPDGKRFHENFKSAPSDFADHPPTADLAPCFPTACCNCFTCRPRRPWRRCTLTCEKSGRRERFGCRDRHAPSHRSIRRRYRSGVIFNCRIWLSWRHDPKPCATSRISISAIIERRKKIKKLTIQNHRLNHQRKAA